jgi:transposase
VYFTCDKTKENTPMSHNKRSYRKGNPRGTKSKFNARKFRRYDKVAIQRHAIRLYDLEKIHPEMIAFTLGVSARSVYRWIVLFKHKGWDVFKLPTPSRKCRLNTDQLSEIAIMIVTKLPSEFGYDTKLWTRKLISEEIFKKYGIQISETHVGRLLRRNKITPQKPIRKAYQQQVDVVRHFKTSVFPQLLNKAKSEGALILWLDETQARSDPNIGRTWGRKGQTPVVPADGKVQKINVIGTIDQNGCTDFMTYEGNTDTSVIISFIDMIAKKKKEKLYIILDNAIYHKSHALNEHIEKYHKGWLELVYLPPYSPELNPAELIWAHLKSHGLNRIISKTRDLFIDAVDKCLLKFSNNVAIGKSLFGKKELDYITQNIPNLLAA